MAVKIITGMTLFDAVLVSCNSLEGLFAMARLNGLSITPDLADGYELQSTGLSYKASALPVVAAVSFKPVQVSVGQTYADLAVQQLGSLEGWFALARLNGAGITDGLISGQQINYSITPFDEQMAQLFKHKGYKPVSGLTGEGQALPEQPDGIGYMIIQSTFKIA